MPKFSSMKATAKAASPVISINPGCWFERSFPMNAIRSIFFFLSRSLLLLIGILLLTIAIPRTDQWNMSLIDFQDGKEKEVIISFPAVKEFTLFSIIKFPIHVSPKAIFITAIIALLALMLLTPSGRMAAINCLRKVRALPFVLLSMGVLIFTLTPTVLPRRNGMNIVLYLTFGSVGLLSSLIGIYPLIVWLGKHRAGQVIRHAVERVVFFFYSINIRYFLIAVFIVAFAITNLLSYFMFEHVPHLGDSIDQVFHGKIMALGKLTVPSHKYREFFSYGNMINDGKWYSQYPPAHSFLMMFGVVLGVTWLVNPIIGSLSIIMFYFIGKEVYDERTGRLAALLGLLSPFVIFMSSGFMSHTSVMFFASLFVLFFIRTVKNGRFYHPLISGSSLGMALNGRPMTALAICIPFAIYAVVLLIKGFRKYMVRFSIMFVTVSAFVGILLLFNYLTTGDPLLFGYIAKFGDGHYPGFGHSPWGKPHSASMGLTQNLNNLNGLNKYLFEWPIPNLFFVFLIFATMTRNKWDYLFISSFWSLSIAYFFYFFQSWYLGPRYLYEVSSMVILLTARGILRTPVLVNETFELNASPTRVKASVGTAIAICTLIALSFNFPTFVKFYSENYRGVNTLVFEAVKENNIENAVVFVRSNYQAVYVANSPLCDGDVIYVKDLGLKNRLMMDYYPDRRYYIADNSEIQEIFPPSDEDVIEAESLKVVDSSGDKAVQQDMSGVGPYWSDNSQLHAETDAKDDYIVLAFPVTAKGLYNVSICLTKAGDFGRMQFFMNGEPVGKVFDGYNGKVVHSGVLSIGETYLYDGENQLRVQIADKNKRASDFRFGVDCFIIKQVSD
ncbi:ArnT family glycosyltransferase [Candidatus Poribacteria bacterium]